MHNGKTKIKKQSCQEEGAKMAYKILIIDDDAELLKMLRKYFARVFDS